MLAGDVGCDRGASERLLAPRIWSPDGAPIQVIVNGTDANTARIIGGYMEGTWQSWLAQRALDEGIALAPPVVAQQRVWFNAEVRSRNFLVPGLIAIIMTLIGALLTAMVVAREWERGTMEALLVTPVTIGEILARQADPLFPARHGRDGAVDRHGGLGLRRPAARVLRRPVRRLGPVHADRARHGPADLDAGAEPVRRRSGRDHRRVPAGIHPVRLHLRHRQHAAWSVQLITHVIPARYFVSSLQTLFLAGHRLAGRACQRGCARR